MKNVKLYKAVFAFTAIVLCGAVIVPQAVQSKVVTNVPADISAKQLQAVVLEDFEQNNVWKINSDPARVANNEKKNSVPILDVKLVAGGPSDMQVEPWAANKKGLEKKQCLGIHFKFKYQGFNQVFLTPPAPLVLTGKGKGISLWFHGRGNAYKLECWVQDWKGDVHILRFGSVNFVGWRPLEVEIPADIPQAIDSYPQTKMLKIIKLVVRAEPTALNNEEIYMFFDQIKVLTDVYEVNFDGMDLEKAFDGGSSSKTSSAPAGTSN